MVTTRLLVVAVILVAGSAAVRTVGHGQPVALSKPFWQFPLSLGGWDGRSVRLEPAIEKKSGVSSYMYRIFTRPESPGRPVHMYVGYYESQQHGEVVHSPNNCLPGAGWFVASRDTLSLDVPPYLPFDVNKFVIANGIERQVVLYWYQQGGGRVVTNEYLGRVHLVLDAVTINRTDAALIRIIVPAADDSLGSVDVSTREAVEFLRASYPELMRYLPHDRPMKRT